MKVWWRLVFGDFPVGAFFGDGDLEGVGGFGFGGPVDGEGAGGVVAVVGEGELVEGGVAEGFFEGSGGVGEFLVPVVVGFADGADEGVAEAVDVGSAEGLEGLEEGFGLGDDGVGEWEDGDWVGRIGLGWGNDW